LSITSKVRDQLSQEISEDMLRKNTEKARKFYKLFNSIGADDNVAIEQLIQQVSSSASAISKLSRACSTMVLGRHQGHVKIISI